MHESVLSFVELQVSSLGVADKRALEIGSANVNGSVRSNFTGPYLGIDLAPGPGVDLVVPGGLIPLPDDYVDVAHGPAGDSGKRAGHRGPLVPMVPTEVLSRGLLIAVSSGHGLTHS